MSNSCEIGPECAPRVRVGHGAWALAACGYDRARPIRRVVETMPSERVVDGRRMWHAPGRSHRLAVVRGGFDGLPRDIDAHVRPLDRGAPGPDRAPRPVRPLHP